MRNSRAGTATTRTHPIRGTFERRSPAPKGAFRMIDSFMAQGLPVAFETEIERHTLADVLSEFDVASTKITETERFRHLTHLFDGGADMQRQSEEQVLVPVARDSLRYGQPESESFRIADKAIRGLESAGRGVFIVNFPAADLMASGGDIGKTIAAIQFIDEVLRRLPFRVHVVQTDNGAEFQSQFHWHLETRDVRHCYIRPRTPRLNGKVERSHRVDDQEFYQPLDQEGISDDIHLFNEKLREWEAALEQTGDRIAALSHFARSVTGDEADGRPSGYWSHQYRRQGSTFALLFGVMMCRFALMKSGYASTIDASAVQSMSATFARSSSATSCARRRHTCVTRSNTTRPRSASTGATATRRSRPGARTRGPG